MRFPRFQSRMLSVACMLGTAAADPPALDMNSDSLSWRAHRNPDTTCVLRGTAVSEMRDDAFEVQFRHSRGQKLKLYVLIPGLSGGGTLFMEAPTTRDRWRVFTDKQAPLLDGDQAESLRRNVAAGIPLNFTFEFGRNKPVRYETVSRGAITAASIFRSCEDENALESLKAVNK